MLTVDEKVKAAGNKVARELIKNELSPDTIGTKKDGNLICRWGYYYTNGMTAGIYMNKIETLLRDNNILFCITNYGNRRTAFKGGASIANQSHFYVEIKIL